MLRPIPREENLYSLRKSLVTGHFNATDKNIDKLAKSGVITGFIKYSSSAVNFDCISSEVRN